MDLRQLRYLVAVADELNFTQAAARCHISQPPLSRAIALLEQEIGARLFERDTHTVVPTPAGECLLVHARKVLEILEEGAAQARQVAAGLRGTLRVGFGGSTVYSLWPSLLRHFRLTVPGVAVRFHAMAVLQQIDALRENEIDVGIVRLPVHDELIETRSVYSEALIVALPLHDAHDFPPGPVDIDALAGRRFVTYQPRRGFNHHADLVTLCRLAGFEPQIAHEAGTTEAVIGIVACGEGVAIVPASAQRLQMSGVAFRPLGLGDIPARFGTVEFALAWHRDRASGVTAEFVQTCLAAPPGLWHSP